MSGVIKASALSTRSARPLSFVPRSLEPSPAEAALDRLREKVIELKEDLKARDDRIARFDSEFKDAADEAFREGEAAGLERAEDRQAERLKLLGDAVDTAREGFNRQLAAAETSAIIVARECLAKLLGDQTHWTALVEDLIRHQLAQVRRDSLIKVEVSVQDFASEQSLAGFGGQVVVEALALPPGSCRMILTLGEIDAGFSQQWSSLQAKLDALIANEMRDAG